MIRLLLVFLVIMAVLSLIRSLMAPSTPARRRAGAPPTTSGRLIKDPVCGTYVAESTALQAGGQFFCSEDCRQKYIAGHA